MRFTGSSEYVATQDLMLAVNAAITLQRPLLVKGEPVEVGEEATHVTPFGTLLRFKKDMDRPQPKVLLVAPLSGHFATLLRGTVETLLVDGMPDAWEQANNLNPFAGADARLDWDEDGLTNSEEFLAGSDPNLALKLTNPILRGFLTAGLRRAAFRVARLHPRTISVTANDYGFHLTSTEPLGSPVGAPARRAPPPPPAWR